MSKRILHLTLHRKWFDLIATGEKTAEFRQITKYWYKRLWSQTAEEHRIYDEIHFRNGYNPKNPFMKVKFLGTVIDRHRKRFKILLGEILEIKNWEGPKK